MFLVPYNTDAPLYHYPIATGVMIVLNVVFFFAFCTNLENDLNGSQLTLDPLSGVEMDDAEKEQFIEELERQSRLDESVNELLAELKEPESEKVKSKESIAAHLVLDWGDGLKPWQWFTSMFMHAGLFHLIGNMIFLWAFGLVIEGKVGPLVFSVLYIGMGAAESMLEQLLMSFSSGGFSLGASSAIFALLALIVIWAPSNSFEILFLFGFKPIMFEMPISIFGLMMFAFNFVPWSWSGGVTTEALHLMGGAIGVPVGLLMLQRRWVDCEGYDLISYFHGKEGDESVFKKNGRRKKKKSAASAQDKEAAARQHAMIENQIAEAIAGGNIDAAVALHQKLVSIKPDHAWDMQQLRQVISAYLKAKDYVKAVPLMESFIDQFPAQRFAMQVYLIKVWLLQQRPRHAFRYMKTFNLTLLSPEEQTQIRNLATLAKKQIDQGVLEMEF
jgi:membrane associated rhomboid family serine protease